MEIFHMVKHNDTDKSHIVPFVSYFRLLLFWECGSHSLSLSHAYVSNVNSHMHTHGHKLHSTKEN